MKENTQNVMELHDKFIYSNKTLKGWSIVIMPNKILIDNFHHGHAHIHPDRKEIKTESLNKAFTIALEHINKNKGINYDKLRGELIK